MKIYSRLTTDGTQPVKMNATLYPMLQPSAYRTMTAFLDPHLVCLLTC